MLCRRETRSTSKDICREYLCNETGYLNLQTFSELMDRFYSWWASVSGGKDCYLLSDNLGCHCNEAVVERETKRRAFLWNIMPGSSYWFQVHDNSPFGALKKNLRHQCDEISFRPTDSPSIRRQLVAGCFYRAEDISFTPSNIQHAFRDVGLWPFDREKILSRARTEQTVKEQEKMEQISNIVSQILKSDKESQERKRAAVLSEVEPRKAIQILPFDHSPLRQIPCAEDRCHLSPVTRLFQSATAEEVVVQISIGSVCTADGCQAKFRSSKKWKFCTTCQSAYCPIHAAAYKKHFIQHDDI